MGECHYDPSPVLCQSGLQGGGLSGVQRGEVEGGGGMDQARLARWRGVGVGRWSSVFEGGWEQARTAVEANDGPFC